MSFELDNLLNKECLIIPFENIKGVIIGIYYSKKGFEYQIRYYLNGKQETEYFFDWEIKIKE